MSDSDSYDGPPPLPAFEDSAEPLSPRSAAKRGKSSRSAHKHHNSNGNDLPRLDIGAASGGGGSGDRLRSPRSARKPHSSSGSGRSGSGAKRSKSQTRIAERERSPRRTSKRDYRDGSGGSGGGGGRRENRRESGGSRAERERDGKSRRRGGGGSRQGGQREASPEKEDRRGGGRYQQYTSSSSRRRQDDRDRDTFSPTRDDELAQLRAENARLRYENHAMRRVVRDLIRLADSLDVRTMMDSGVPTTPQTPQTQATGPTAHVPVPASTPEAAASLPPPLLSPRAEEDEPTVAEPVALPKASVVPIASGGDGWMKAEAPKDRIRSDSTGEEGSPDASPNTQLQLSRGPQRRAKSMRNLGYDLGGPRRLSRIPGQDAGRTKKIAALLGEAPRAETVERRTRRDSLNDSLSDMTSVEVAATSGIYHKPTKEAVARADKLEKMFGEKVATTDYIEQVVAHEAGVGGVGGGVGSGGKVSRWEPTKHELQIAADDLNMKVKVLKGIYAKLNEISSDNSVNYGQFREFTQYMCSNHKGACAYLGSYLTELMFGGFEKDRTGAVGFTEVVQFTSIFFSAELSDRIRFIFQVYDRKSLGYLEKSNVFTVLSQITDGMNEGGGGGGGGGGGEPILSPRGGMFSPRAVGKMKRSTSSHQLHSGLDIKQRVDELFAIGDIDCDQHISVRDFTIAATVDPSFMKQWFVFSNV